MAKNNNSKLKNNVWWLGLVSFLNDAGSEMLTPIYPLFMTNVLGANGFAIGLIEGFGKASESILSIFSGWYSDRIRKRKPVMAAGYLLSTLTKGLFAFTSSWPQFFGVRIIERTGKAIRDPPRDALLAESTAHSSVKERRQSFAIQRMLDKAGNVLGPIMALGLIAYLSTDFEKTARTLFLLALIPGMLAVGVILFLVKEPQERKERPKRDGLRQLMRIGRYGEGFDRILVASVLMFMLAPVLAFFYLKAQSVGFDVGNIVFMGAIYGITYMVGAGSLSFLSRFARIEKQHGVILSMLLISFAFFLTSISNDTVSFLVPFILYGMATGIFEAESRAYISLVVDKKMLGAAFGTFHTVIGLMLLVAGLISGYMWDISSAYMFQLAGASSLAALVFFSVNSRKG